MEKKERTKTILILILIVGIVSMTVAYAQLTQRLNINATGKVLNKDNWNVHFDDPVGPATTGYASIEEGKGLVRRGTTTLENLVAVLKAPGDSVSYTFNVKNDGELDAKISDVFMSNIVDANYNGASEADKTLVKQYIYYTLVYTNSGVAPKMGDVLAKGQSVNMTLTIGYSSEAPSLPDATVTVSGINAHIDYEMK